ncbi:MAG: glycosyltransferase family 2 protein [Caldisphaera sp.]
MILGKETKAGIFKRFKYPKKSLIIDTKMKGDITAVIIAYNAENIIENCLKSVKWCDDIVVIVNSKTTDKTFDIAKKYTENVHYGAYKIGFDELRVQALKYIKTEWIFIIDTDERVPSGLALKIKEIIKTDKYDVIKIPVLSWTWGKFLTSLSKFDRRVVFKNNVGTFLPHLHNIVYIKPNEKAIEIKDSYIIHYSHLTLHQTLEKTNEYTDIAAKEYYLKNIHYSHKLLLSSLLKTFYYYFFKVGIFKDGIQGIIFGINSLYADLITFMKLYELDNNTYQKYESLDESG